MLNKIKSKKIDPKKLIEFLKKKKINFFSGVPDSCTLQFCNQLLKTKNIKNIVAANEGVAVSHGVGHYLATKRLPCIYLQNSGIGNATDPITNLCEKNIYNIPLLLLIGWRGAPGIKDEPQHYLQGRIMTRILKLYGIKYIEIKSNGDFKKISKLISYSKKKSARVALIVKPNSFEKLHKTSNTKEKSDIKRIDVINVILKKIKKKTKIISSVGYNSRELHQMRLANKNFLGQDFLMVGAMGHTAATAMSMSSYFKGQVLCLDGDGSFIMHLGSFSSISKLEHKNFKYILIDNASHESIGGQPINLKHIDIKSLAKSLNFKKFFSTNKKANLPNIFETFLNSDGPSFFHIKINKGTLENLIRPKNLIDIKNNFINKN